MKRSGIADLPLHGGRVPEWLAQRMTRLGTAITEAIAYDYGTSAFLSRLSDPFWFQALRSSRTNFPSRPLLMAVRLGMINPAADSSLVRIASMRYLIDRIDKINRTIRSVLSRFVAKVVAKFFTLLRVYSGSW